MGLKPWEFDELTIMEFYAMLDGCYEYKLGERRAAAWFVANIMASSGNYKHGIDIEKLLAPFVKKKNAAQIDYEKEQFFDEFFEQRKECSQNEE